MTTSVPNTATQDVRFKAFHGSKNSKSGLLSRASILVFSIMVYGIFLGTFLYTIGFVANAIVPKTIDSGDPSPLGMAVLLNATWLGLFAIQHTIMARPGFKKWWTQFVPVAVERSIFVLVTSAILIALCWQWRPLPQVIWQVESPMLEWGITALSLSGWVLVLVSTFMIDHFDLFGLRQALCHFRGVEAKDPKFMKRGAYRFVRHPLMLGFLIAFWATPVMTWGHALFAILVTLYILVGTKIEERDLVRFLGNDYIEYRKTTPGLVPRPMGK